MKKITGQCVKVQTTADECVRITVDIDTRWLKDVNIIAWKNNMVEMELVEDSVTNFEDE